MTRADLPAVPYPGIEPFAYAEREVFFARAPEARRLIRLITLYRGVLLFAASGVGKSSLVNAGVIPLAIEEGHHPERLRVQPRMDEEILVEPIPGLPSILADGSEPDVLSIESFLERVRAQAAEARPLLIFDQFEEWVTLFEKESVYRERVLNALCSLIADGQLPVKILIVLREDYLANLQPLFERCPNLSDHYLRLTALGDEEALRRTIRGPFETYPGVYEPEIGPALASWIVGQLTARADGNGVPLTEVQIVCRTLFEAGRQGKDPAGLFEAQGVQGILERYLEGALDELGPKLRDPAVALLSRMITSAGTRNVITRDDLVERVALEDGISRARLGTALDDLEKKTHLVRKEMRREVHFYEIVSEFLVDWIRRQAERLKAERASRRLRHIRRLAIISGVGSLTLFGMLLFMWLSWREADRQGQLRTSQRLADVSGESDENTKALLFAVESVRRARKAGVEPFPEAVDNLRRALARSPGHALGGYGKPVLSAAMSPDGSWLAGAGKRGVLYLWRASKEGLEADPVELPGHEGPLQAVTVSLDGHWLAVSGGRTIALWKLVPREDRPRLLPAPDDLKNLLFSADGEWLVAAGEDQVPRVWSLRGEPAGEGLPLARCRATRWSGSASLRWIAVGCEDGVTELWDLHGASPKVRMLPRRSDEEVWALAFSRQEDLLATGGVDGSVRLWSLDRPGSLADDPSGEADVLALAFHPDGSRLAIGRGDGTVGLWRIDGTRAFPEKPSRAVWSPESRLTWSADGDWLLVRGPKGDYRLGTLSFSDRLIPARDFGGSLRTATTAAFSPDGRWLVAGTADSLAYEALSRPSTESVRVDEGPVQRLHFGRGVFLTRTSTGLARLWDMTHESWGDGDEPRVSRGHGPTAAPERSATSPGGPGGAWHLDVASDVPVVRGRGTADSLARHEGGATDWAFSGDGRWLATGDQGGTARLYALPPEMVQAVQHVRSVTFVRFSPDSRRLITLGGEAMLWRLEPFTTHPLEGHAGKVTTAGFSADSRWLATADDRGRVLLWDLSREPLQATVLPGFQPAAITRVQVDSTARRVFADDAHGNRWEWRMDLDELIDLACRTVGRNLRPGEWNLYIDDYDGRTCPDFPPPETP